MNVSKLLWDAARSHSHLPLPILSFPAAQLLDVPVEALVKDAALQARAMAVIAQRTTSLAAVSLMDLSVEAEAFGAQVLYFPDDVPAVTGQLVSTLEQAQELTVPDLTKGRASVCIEGIRLAKEQIQDRPVLAGMIGPFSLAGRLMDVTEVIYVCYDEPEVVHAVLEKATAYLIQYGKAMKQAGADGIVMAEPLAGILRPDMAEEFSHPYVTQVIQALQEEDFAVIYHNCGNAVGSMLPEIFSLGAAAYHFGNAVDMAHILSHAPADALCMGNIDPASQFVQGTPESITAVTRELLEKCGSYPNFIPSSGCDIPYHASWENIRAFFDALR